MRKEVESISKSLRSTRVRALLPRIVVYAVLAVIGIAGLRTIIAGPAEPPAVAASPKSAGLDPAAEAFAEGFAAVYLSWDANHLNQRERELAAYLPSAIDNTYGLSPAPGSSQQIAWTAVMGASRSESVLNVTVAARVDDGNTLHVTLPVGRDDDGFLYLAGYPALVGAPPVADPTLAPEGDEVTDEQLETVVARAITNYLAGARENLLADLTPGALVSIPDVRLNVSSVETPTWLVPNRRVVVLVAAEDQENNTWNLRYELDVRRSDRWYVRGIEADPTLKGGA
jgi:hypothetical protein